MLFKVQGKRLKTITIDIWEEVDGEVEITKKEVQRMTDCPDKVDGDSTYWYGEVADALGVQAEHKFTGEVTEVRRVEKVEHYWTDVEDVDW